MTHLQQYWEGVSLSGQYTLEKWLGGDESVSFFQISLAPDGRPAVLKLIPAEIDDGAEQLELWRRIRQLRHPNLVELLDCGRAEYGGETALYAVFESADESLGAALSRSPLNEPESREVLDSVLDAVRYLHAQGLVLGTLDVDRIVAVGDRVKLSTDSLREADSSSAYRKDVQLFGELWQQALMPASPRSAEIAAHAADPNPEARWTLAEVSAALEPLAPPAPPPAPEPVVAAPIVLPVALPPPPPVSEPKVVRMETPPVPAPPRRIQERAGSSSFPKWVLLAGTGLLALVLALNWPRRVVVATQPPVAPVTAPAETPATVPAPTPAIAPAPNTADRKLVEPPAPRRPPAGEEVWRVIAFTFKTRDAAARKAHQLNEYHPGLDAAVFAPNNKGYYLVSLGGAMTHEEAERLKRGTRGKGLPRDLYVQNYSR